MSLPKTLERSLEAAAPRRIAAGAWIALALLLTPGCGFLPSRSPLPPPKSSRHPVDFREALTFAERADAVYHEDHRDIHAALPNILTVEDLPRSSVRFLVQSDAQGRQHIAIRGTDNLENVRVDSTTIPTRDGKLGISLHKGFAAAATELYVQLRPRLNPRQPVTITGHSLGGAIAVILAMYLHVDNFSVERVITFGQPKVTNAEGATRYARLPLLRFVNDDDPVADVPPAFETESGEWRYAHLGPEVILRGDRGYAFLEEHQVSARSVRSFFDRLGDHEVDDHRIAAYLEGLTRRLDGGEEIPFEE